MKTYAATFIMSDKTIYSYELKSLCLFLSKLEFYMGNTAKIIIINKIKT